ncbi:glycosyltransferase family 4 protein [Maritalea sp.]|uniref:glycosyltransferase family 4 protein n=1 Tax=Maritalea sp. TaxID=2003361 RepID=UPI003EF8CF89
MKKNSYFKRITKKYAGKFIGPARLASRNVGIQLNLQIGGSSLAFDLDEQVAMSAARKWEFGPRKAYVDFLMPPRVGKLLRAKHPLDISALATGDDRPTFLVFNLPAAMPEMAKQCAVVIRVKAKSSEEPMSYRIGLADPRPEVVPIPPDFERLNLFVRVAGEGRLSSISVSLGVPERLKLGESQASPLPPKLVERRIEQSKSKKAFDWQMLLDDEHYDEALLATLVGQGGAIRAHFQNVIRHLAAVQRQIEDLHTSGRSKIDKEVIAFKQQVYDILSSAITSEMKLSKTLSNFSKISNNDAGGGKSKFRRVPTHPEWRKEVVKSAIPFLEDSHLPGALQQIWRQVDFIDSKVILEEFAEQISPECPDLAYSCLVLSLGIEPSAHRVRHAAGKLFKWGFLTKSHALLSVSDLPDTRFIGELRLAVYLRDHAADLVVERRPRQISPGNKIAYVASSSQPWSISGYTNRTHELLSALQRAGEEVVCFTRPGFPWDRPNVLNEAEEVGTEQSLVDEVGYVHSPTDFVEEDPLTYIQRAAQSLVDRFRADPPAVVHAASNYRNGLPALIAARQLGIPFVYEVRGLWELTAASRQPGWENTERYAYERQMENLIVSEADLVLTITSAVKRELLTPNDDKEKFHLLSNAVDPLKFRPTDRDSRLAERLGISDDDLVLVYAGSLLEYEGIDDVIKAVGLLRARDVPAKFIVVGDGRARESLEALVATLNLEEHVIFKGRVRPDQVRFYLSLAQIVPITRKKFRVCSVVSPLKPFEAMSMEKTVIVSDLDALCEIVEDGVRGRICKAEDPEDLARIIEDLHSDRTQLDSMGKTARRWIVEHRSWEHHAKKLRSLYGELTD